MCRLKVNQSSATGSKEHLDLAPACFCSSLVQFVYWDTASFPPREHLQELDCSFKGRYKRTELTFSLKSKGRAFFFLRALAFGGTRGGNFCLQKYMQISSKAK